MPKLGSLSAGDEQKIEIPTPGGEVVHVVMHPGKLTGDAIMGVVDQPNEAQSFVAICDLLAETIDSWDITDDDGSDFPVERSSIRKLPLAFVMTIFDKMQESQNPPTPSGKSFTSG